MFTLAVLIALPAVFAEELAFERDMFPWRRPMIVAGTDDAKKPKARRKPAEPLSDRLLGNVFQPYPYFDEYHRRYLGRHGILGSMWLDLRGGPELAAGRDRGFFYAARISWIVGEFNAEGTYYGRRREGPRDDDPRALNLFTTSMRLPIAGNLWENPRAFGALEYGVGLAAFARQDGENSVGFGTSVRLQLFPLWPFEVAVSSNLAVGSGVFVATFKQEVSVQLFRSVFATAAYRHTVWEHGFEAGNGFQFGISWMFNGGAGHHPFANPKHKLTW